MLPSLAFRLSLVTHFFISSFSVLVFICFFVRFSFSLSPSLSPCVVFLHIRIVSPTKLRHESFSHGTVRSAVRVWPCHDTSTASPHAAHCLDSVYSATARSPGPIVKSNDNMHNIYKCQTHVAQLRLKPS